MGNKIKESIYLKKIMTIYSYPSLTLFQTMYTGRSFMFVLEIKQGLFWSGMLRKYFMMGKRKQHCKFQIVRFPSLYSSFKSLRGFIEAIQSSTPYAPAVDFDPECLQLLSDRDKVV